MAKPADTAALQARMAELAASHKHLLDRQDPPGGAVILTLYARGWVATAWLGPLASVRPVDSASTDYFVDPAVALADLNLRLTVLAARLGIGEAA